MSAYLLKIIWIECFFPISGKITRKFVFCENTHVLPLKCKSTNFTLLVHGKMICFAPFSILYCSILLCHLKPTSTLQASPFRRGMPSHTHAPTNAQKCLDVWKIARQMKLLAIRFSYIIACAWSRYMTLLYALETTFLLISLL